MRLKMNVCVLGAGVVGLGTAVQLAEALPGVHVTLTAHGFRADTTSAGAAGLWEPYKLGACILN